MKKYLYSLIVVAFFAACSDDSDVNIPKPTNITLNELTLERFSHNVPDGGFTSQGIHFNTVKGANGQLEGGFCYSNRSLRSFTWTGTEAAVDSMRYSVWSTKPNNTEVYAVGHVNGDDTYFTLDTPSTIDYILVSNTTWAYLSMSYGDSFGTAEKPEINPNIPSKPKGIWHTYVPGGVKKFVKEDKDYMRLTAKGYNNNQSVGSVTLDLACRGANAENPTWDYYVTDWTKMDLSSLGVVDKVVFYLESSDVDTTTGKMRTPAWFCLDGIQLMNE